MKKITFLLALAFSVALSAQVESDKGYFGVTLGTGIPIGPFAGSNAGVSGNGYANPGLSMDLTYAGKLWKDFGLSTNFHMQTNPLNGQKLLDNATPPTATSSSIEANSYLTFGLLTGPWCSAALSDKISIEARLSGGYLFCSPPDITISATTLGQTSTLVSTSKLGGGLAYQLGVGMRYNLSKTICLNADINLIADLLMEFAIDAIIATNTTISRDAVLGMEHGQEAGGLSGAPVRKASNAVIKTLKARLGNELPIIGVGGIMSGADAREKIMAGASLVQLYSGLIYRGPDLVNECAAAIRHP